MAFTQQSGNNAWVESQSLTAAAPSASSDGVALKGLDTLQVVVEANSGQTLSGAGTLDGYLWDDYINGWSRCAELDKAVATSSVRRLAFNFSIDGCRQGTRICWKANGVTVSSGSTVNVYVIGGRERGE